jgi:hypothetical protein
MVVTFEMTFVEIYFIVFIVYRAHLNEICIYFSATYLNTKYIFPPSF